MDKTITPNKIWHSPLNFYYHQQKLLESVGLETVEKDRQYQAAREARVGAVLSLIMFARLDKPTYFQLYKPDPPDLILMQPNLKTGNRDITQVEVTHYIGNPNESLLERLKRKDPPGRHHYSSNYILVVNVGMGLSPNFDEVNKYLLANLAPFPLWAIQEEIPGHSDTTSRLVIVNPEKYETIVDIGAAAYELEKLHLPDVIHSKRAGKLESVRMGQSEKFYKAPWETIGM